jgi:hypothetical protein
VVTLELSVNRPLARLELGQPFRASRVGLDQIRSELLVVYLFIFLSFYLFIFFLKLNVECTRYNDVGWSDSLFTLSADGGAAKPGANPASYQRCVLSGQPISDENGHQMWLHIFIFSNSMENSTVLVTGIRFGRK